jgi:hypothetical protein
VEYRAVMKYGEESPDSLVGRYLAEEEELEQKRHENNHQADRET